MSIAQLGWQQKSLRCRQEIFMEVKEASGGRSIKTKRLGFFQAVTLISTNLCAITCITRPDKLTVSTTKKILSCSSIMSGYEGIRHRRPQSFDRQSNDHSRCGQLNMTFPPTVPLNQTLVADDPTSAPFLARWTL